MYKGQTVELNFPTSKESLKNSGKLDFRYAILSHIYFLYIISC